MSNSTQKKKKSFIQSLAAINHYKNTSMYEIDVPLEVLIDKTHLVLDVGGGPNAVIRSNYVIDKHVGYGERANPSVGAYKYIQFNGDALPFTDKAFDWVFTRHTLEHVRYPDIFLKELDRVAKNLYIITPSPLSEYYGHGTDHFWVVYVKSGKLHVEAIPPYFKYERVRARELSHLKELEDSNEGKVGNETVYIKTDKDPIKYEIIGDIDADRYDVMNSLYHQNDNLQGRQTPSYIQQIKHGNLHDYLIKDALDNNAIFSCPRCSVKLTKTAATNEFICQKCSEVFSESQDHIWDFTLKSEHVETA